MDLSFLDEYVLLQKMEQVGLIPSDTGEPGGNKTGQHMSHYIDSNGQFIRAFKRMPTEYVLPWMSHEQEKPPSPKSPKKIKLTCPECNESAGFQP